MDIDKEQLRRAILDELTGQLYILRTAVNAAVSATTHADARAEGKYDTRAIESGYIAGAQAERLKDLENRLRQVAAVKLGDFHGGRPIAETALVALSDDAGQKTTYYLTKAASGLRLDVGGQVILTISPASHLGSVLIGKQEGDELDFTVGGKERALSILNVR